MLMSKSPQGQAIAMRVHEGKDETVVVDLNHPLADKTLNFDVKVTDIRAAEAR
jgi:FKBP-type peptidyl-prolyl cis-trans isomerase SlyD